MKIKKFNETFCICQVEDFSQVDLSDDFCFISKTNEEKSIVLSTEHIPKNCIKRDDGWKMFRIEGILDFSLIGILSKISTILATAGIGIFAVSTYNTDYILIKEENYQKAITVLSQNGYDII